jgi:hypothetical protein
MKKITVVPRGSNNSKKKKLALYIFNKPMQEARNKNYNKKN